MKKAEGKKLKAGKRLMKRAVKTTLEEKTATATDFFQGMKVVDEFGTTGRVVLISDRKVYVVYGKTTVAYTMDEAYEDLIAQDDLGNFIAVKTRPTGPDNAAYERYDFSSDPSFDDAQFDSEKDLVGEPQDLEAYEGKRPVDNNNTPDRSKAAAVGLQVGDRVRFEHNGYSDNVEGGVIGVSEEFVSVKWEDGLEQNYYNEDRALVKIGKVAFLDLNPGDRVSFVWDTIDGIIRGEGTVRQESYFEEWGEGDHGWTIDPDDFDLGPEHLMYDDELTKISRKLAQVTDTDIAYDLGIKAGTEDALMNNPMMPNTGDMQDQGNIDAFLAGYATAYLQNMSKTAKKWATDDFSYQDFAAATGLQGQALEDAFIDFSCYSSDALTMNEHFESWNSQQKAYSKTADVWKVVNEFDQYAGEQGFVKEMHDDGSVLLGLESGVDRWYDDEDLELVSSTQASKTAQTQGQDWYDLGLEYGQNDNVDYRPYNDMNPVTNDQFAMDEFRRGYEAGWSEANSEKNGGKIAVQRLPNDCTVYEQGWDDADFDKINGEPVGYPVEASPEYINGYNDYLERHDRLAYPGLYSAKKVAGTELWQTPEGEYWLLSTVTMTPAVEQYFETKEDAIQGAVESGRWNEVGAQVARDKQDPDGIGYPDDFYSPEFEASKTADQWERSASEWTTEELEVGLQYAKEQIEFHSRQSDQEMARYWKDQRSYFQSLLAMDKNSKTAFQKGDKVVIVQSMSPDGTRGYTGTIIGVNERGNVVKIDSLPGEVPQAWPDEELQKIGKIAEDDFPSDMEMAYRSGKRDGESDSKQGRQYFPSATEYIDDGNDFRAEYLAGYDDGYRDIGDKSAQFSSPIDQDAAYRMGQDDGWEDYVSFREPDDRRYSVTVPEEFFASYSAGYKEGTDAALIEDQRRER